MATNSENRWTRLSIDIEPELQRKIQIAASRKDLSVRDYVITVLQHALVVEEDGEAPSDEAEWARLSARSFARDWDSDEDQVYESPADDDAVESRPEFAAFMAFLAESALSRHGRPRRGRPWRDWP